MTTYTSRTIIRAGDKSCNEYYQRFFSKINGKILDVGCGVGNFVALDPENIMGIDNDKEAIKICAKRGLDCKVMDIVPKINFPDNSFSAVNASQIIEHLDDPLQVMKEFFRVLCPGGLLVLAAPDAKKIKHLFWDDYTHKRPYTKRSLEQLASDAGFIRIKTIYEPLPIRGLGAMARKKIISAGFIMSLQNILTGCGITHNSIYLSAEKPT